MTDGRPLSDAKFVTHTPVTDRTLSDEERTLALMAATIATRAFAKGMYSSDEIADDAVLLARMIVQRVRETEQESK